MDRTFIGDMKYGFSRFIDKLKEWLDYFRFPSKPDIGKYIEEATEEAEKRSQLVADMTVREATVAIERIKPNDGDVLLVTIKNELSANAYANIAESLKELADKTGYRDRGVTMLFLVGGVEIKALSEADMKKHGWVRSADDEQRI